MSFALPSEDYGWSSAAALAVGPDEQLAVAWHDSDWEHVYLVVNSEGTWSELGEATAQGEGPSLFVCGGSVATRVLLPRPQALPGSIARLGRILGILFCVAGFQATRGVVVRQRASGLAVGPDETPAPGLVTQGHDDSAPPARRELFDAGKPEQGRIGPGNVEEPVGAASAHENRVLVLVSEAKVRCARSVRRLVDADNLRLEGLCGRAARARLALVEVVHAGLTGSARVATSAAVAGTERVGFAAVGRIGVAVGEPVQAASQECLDRLAGAGLAFVHPRAGVSVAGCGSCLGYARVASAYALGRAASKVREP